MSDRELRYRVDLAQQEAAALRDIIDRAREIALHWHTYASEFEALQALSSLLAEAPSARERARAEVLGLDP